MKRLITLAGLALVFAAMFGLYELSYRVDRQEARLRDLTARIASEKQAIAVLRAEWAYLTRPQAIEDRAVGILGMLPPLPRQTVSFTQVPEREQRLITSVAAEGGTRFVATLGGDLIPLPRRRPGGLPPAVMTVEVSAQAPGGGARGATPARAEPKAVPAVMRVERPAAQPPAAPPRAAGGRLLPADMEAHLLKVAAGQLAGGGAVRPAGGVR